MENSGLFRNMFYRKNYAKNKFGRPDDWAASAAGSPPTDGGRLCWSAGLAGVHHG